MCVKVVIQYLTCGFRLVSSTGQNVMSQGIPIFGSFCRPLRNVVTETFAEPSENWEVSSNRILTGTISRPSCPFISVKLVIQDLTCGFRPVCTTRQNAISRGLPIFKSFYKPPRNFATKHSNPLVYFVNRKELVYQSIYNRLITQIIYDGGSVTCVV